MPYDIEHGKLWQDIKADLDKTRTRASKLAANAEWAFGKKTARVLGVLALFAVAVILLFVFLDLYIAPTKPSGKKDLVLAVAQILAGAALLSGLYFTWRTLQVNREGQITERFTRAIDQLGKVEDGQKLFEIRIGGIYALERIARESEEDYWPIMEILTAYVRKNASLLSEKESREEGADKQDRPAPDPDIQAIMTVLQRRTRFYGHGEPEKLDLGETNLSGANLSGANLSGANLMEANLMEANRMEANLMEANLSGAILLEADLSGANLSVANLSGAILAEAKGITNEELWRQIPVLEGATMPDGQKYEDWLKERD